MKNKLPICMGVVVLGVSIYLGGNFILKRLEFKPILVGPGPGVLAAKTTPSSEPSPNIKIPKSFQFDETTDLQKELDQVSPEVTDQDFSPLH
jgi:hypothetical protein